MRRYLKEASLLPHPTRDVRRFGEYDGFVWFCAEISEVEFLYDSDVVPCTIVLVVSSDYDVILELYTSSLFDVFTKNFC